MGIRYQGFQELGSGDWRYLIGIRVRRFWNGNKNLGLKFDDLGWCLGMMICELESRIGNKELVIWIEIYNGDWTSELGTGDLRLRMGDYDSK